ncbi:MAG: DUF1792 domain-containing protein [Lachnospiraceae bacterium]|jgi:glycosyltransferase family protein|nr:DUF1792 domain-containing protein [Lachnospiraceae bacterium]
MYDAKGARYGDGAKRPETKKVIFWAAGANANNFMTCLKEETEVVAVVDNDALRWGEAFGNSTIISADAIQSYPYDYIVITTPDYADILQQLCAMGIDADRILTPFAPERGGRQEWREIFHVGELLYYVQELRMTKMSWALQNAPYEISAGIEKGCLARPKIRSIGETIERLREGYSMSRYGDGELNMILGRNFSTFQSSDEALIQRLKQILKSNLSNHIVCLPDIYGDFYNRNEEHKNWFRRHLADGGREYDYRIFDMDRVYYNAFITRPYKDYVDKRGVEERFLELRLLWENRDVTIIEGEKTRFGVGNDLISNAVSCERILGPAVNAFEKYRELLAAAKKTDRDRLILIALGHTATVLAYDLAAEGYQALDIGHLDIEYEWFLRKTDKKIPIEGKFVNEAPLGRIVAEPIGDKKYLDEIINVIL